MRKFLILLVFVLAAAGAARSQEGRGSEVGGDYQYVRFNPGNGASGINCQGGSGTFAAYLTSSVGVVGEFGACKVTGMPTGVSSHAVDYLFGRRWCRRDPDEPRYPAGVTNGVPLHPLQWCFAEQFPAAERHRLALWQDRCVPKPQFTTLRKFRGGSEANPFSLTWVHRSGCFMAQSGGNQAR